MNLQGFNLKFNFDYFSYLDTMILEGPKGGPKILFLGSLRSKILSKINYDNIFDLD